MDRACHQFLADTAFTEDEHRGFRLGDLLDELVDLLHRLGIADDVARLELGLQLGAQTAVFVFERDLVDVLDQVKLDRLRGGARQDRQHLDIEFEQAAVVVDALGADSAEHLLAALDRHTQERQFFVGQVVARAGAVQKVGFFADARHDDGLAGFDHLARDAFAEVVDAARGLVFGQAEAVMNEDLARGRVEQADHAAHHIHVALHQAQQDRNGLLEVAGFARDAAHFVEQRQQISTAFAEIAFAIMRRAGQRGALGTHRQTDRLACGPAALGAVRSGGGGARCGLGL